MRFGMPQCGVALEIPATSTNVGGGSRGRTGWHTVSVDQSGNLWAVDEGTRRNVYLFEAQNIAAWSRRFAENNPLETLPTDTCPVATLEDSGDCVLQLVHGDHHAPAWTWVLSAKGSVMLVNASSRAVASNHRVGSSVTAGVLVSPGVLAVATQGTNEDYSEVIEMVYSEPSSSPSGRSNSDRHRQTAKGRALFRLRDHVECLVVAAHVPRQDAQNVSVASVATSVEGQRALLFTITRQGNVDVWDATANGDATSEFDDLRYDADALGAPTCGAVVGGSLWIGTAFGPVVVVPLQPGGGAPQVLQHHKARVTSMLSMTLGTRAWSCCADGVVAVWSSATLKPCGQFDMQDVPMRMLQAAPHQLLTSVWGVDSEHRARCWEVREQFRDKPQLAAATDGHGGEGTSTGASRGGDRRHNDVHHFVSGLCDVLTGRATECHTPTSLDTPLPEARYLPDALMSLSECRGMIFDTFRALKWPSVSLSEDVRTLVKHARGRERASQRASDIAKRLSTLTPAFPLPSDVSEPMEQLVIAAECVLEEVLDRGVLCDPNRTQDAVGAATGGKASTLDDSGIPEVQHLSEHIFETQLQALETQLAEERKRSLGQKNHLENTERELDRLSGEMAALREAQEHAVSEAERWKKAHHAMKKRLQAAQMETDNERAALAQELDEAKREIRELRQAASDEGASGARASASRSKSANRLHSVKVHDEADRIIKELLHMQRGSCQQMRALRSAAIEVLKELDDTKHSFREMEKAGRAMIAGLESERMEAVEMVASLQRSLQPPGRSLDRSSLVAKVASLSQLLGGNLHRDPQPHDDADDRGRAPTSGGPSNRILRVAF